MKNILKNLMTKINPQEKSEEAPQKPAKTNLFLLVLGVGAALLFTVYSPRLSQTVLLNDEEKPSSTKNFTSVGDDISNKIFVQQIEDDYNMLKSKLKELTEQTKSWQEQTEDDQRFLGEYIQKLNQNIDGMREQLNQLENPNPLKRNLDKLGGNFLNNSHIKDMKLNFVKILPLNEPPITDKTVRLPLGSYCKGTLMTGVHAPADQDNPLPVLIRLDEAFVGPNSSRIPLKGTFILGKAVGDLVSKRAYIQIIGLSTILPDGRSFEKEANLGYITDQNKSFGIKGEVVENSGRSLGMSFLTGFMSGAAQAFSDAETTSVVGSEGQVSRVVTGNAVKNASFQGLASSASQLSEFYQGRLDEIVPSIWVESNQPVYFYVQKGVTIEGFKINETNDVSFID